MKISYLGIFWVEFEKNYCHFRNQYATFHAKIKKLTFRTKTALFGYSRARISKNHCHCLIAKFCAKIKIFRFGTKNA